MKYTIKVCRIGYAFTDIEVEAENQELAEGLALDEAGDHLYSEKSSDYVLEGTTKGYYGQGSSCEPSSC